jgi:hypothetical protein
MSRKVVDRSNYASNLSDANPGNRAKSMVTGSMKKTTGAVLPIYVCQTSADPIPSPRSSSPWTRVRASETGIRGEITDALECLSAGSSDARHALCQHGWLCRSSLDSTQPDGVIFHPQRHTYLRGDGTQDLIANG